MAQVFVELQNTTAGSRMNMADRARIQLSDGTDVWVEYDPAVSTYYVRYSTDHQTVNDLSTLGGLATGGGLELVDIARDASDNLYVLGLAQSDSETFVLQGFVKGSGYTWTAEAQVTGPAQSAALDVLRCEWLNTGGGTDGDGHLVIFTHVSGDIFAFVVDAGALLQSSPTYTQTGYSPVASWSASTPCIDSAADGFGATTGLVAAWSSSGAAYVWVWVVSNTGILTTNFAGETLTGTSSGPIGIALVRYGSGAWALLGPSSVGDNAIMVWPCTTTGIGTGMDSGQTGVTGPWAAYCDPGGSKVWVLVPEAAGGGSCVVLNGSWTPVRWFGFTTADTLTDAYATPTALRAVKQPVVSTITWDASLQTSSTQYALDGDFTMFGTAPDAPTLISPSSGAYFDVSSGITLTAEYNSSDEANQNAYALRVKLSTAGGYIYYNAGTNALQSGIVWNGDSVTQSAEFSATLPSTAVSDGNTYNWSFASQEASDNLQGPFASDFTFVAQGGPTLSVEAPTGTVTTTAQPTVQWTATPGTGGSITAYRVVIYTQAQTEIGGFTPGTSPSTWDSGTIAGSATQLQVGTPLANNTTFYAFVQVTETGSVTSDWGFSSFTETFNAPATPTITATATTDPDTGCPMIQLEVQGSDNLLSLNDASPNLGVGTWQEIGNCALSPSGAGLEMVALTHNPMSAGTAGGTTGYPVLGDTEYTAVASFLAATTDELCAVGFAWYDASGGLISQVSGDSVIDNTESPTQATVTATSPSVAAFAQVVVSVSS